MNIIAGLIPFEGTIVLEDSIDLRKHPFAYRRLVNHAPAEPAYPSFLTGSDLLLFNRSVRKDTDERVEETRRILGIDNFLDNPTGSYSSGMLKKLSLLMAFVGNPSWILLDEPFTTLDHASQEALCQLIVRRHHQDKTSFLLTSHHDIDAAGIPFSKSFLLKDKHLTETATT